mgnify:CR=1 FL=1
MSNDDAPVLVRPTPSQPLEIWATDRIFFVFDGFVLEAFGAGMGSRSHIAHHPRLEFLEKRKLPIVRVNTDYRVPLEIAYDPVRRPGLEYLDSVLVASARERRRALS